MVCESMHLHSCRASILLILHLALELHQRLSSCLQLFLLLHVPFLQQEPSVKALLTALGLLRPGCTCDVTLAYALALPKASLRCSVPFPTLNLFPLKPFGLLFSVPGKISTTWIWCCVVSCRRAAQRIFRGYVRLREALLQVKLLKQLVERISAQECLLLWIRQLGFFE